MEDLGPDWLPQKELGEGAFGHVHLFLHKPSNLNFAVKFVDRKKGIDKTVHAEIVNHKALQHESITRFKELILTPTKLAIVMEYVGGGDLFSYVTTSPKRKLPEAVSRYFFQQLVSGLDYMQSQGVCHRDIKLENTLVSGTTPPVLKLCDFGYSKSQTWQSNPHSTVGTLACIAPEVLCKPYDTSSYDAKAADMWSCGVLLHAMLAGAFPFCSPADNDQRALHKMKLLWEGKTSYTPPSGVSVECVELLGRIFTAQPQNRITLGEIQNLKWFRTNLPKEFDNLAEDKPQKPPPFPQQSTEEFEAILQQILPQEG
ncbi:kinase super protein [Cymbomonas tetramitiformis]|uniref:non-specific serine/threonine protein kinase n=1 Tax=Cymbomonas tetramitiformis TaxID=36881 RepID=A0AAE0FXU7_9CHLO|nr:kinase super protein [Cymbomonas tetramitiformis]